MAYGLNVWSNTGALRFSSVDRPIMQLSIYTGTAVGSPYTRTISGIGTAGEWACLDLVGNDNAGMEVVTNGVKLTGYNNVVYKFAVYRR